MNYPLGDWLHNKISRQEYKEKMAIYRDKQSQYVAKRLFEIYGFEIARRDLNMSSGKLAAQVSSAFLIEILGQRKL